MKHFNCYDCKDNVPVELLNKGTYYKPTNRGRCKPCHSIRNTTIHIEKRLKKSVKDYMYCDDCDKSFYGYDMRTGKTKRETCIKCKSKNISLYKETG